MRQFLFLSLIINYFGVPLHTVPSLAQGRPNTPIELSPQVGAGGLLVAVQDGTSHRRAVAYSHIAHGTRTHVRNSCMLVKFLRTILERRLALAAGIEVKQK